MRTGFDWIVFGWRVWNRARERRYAQRLAWWFERDGAWPPLPRPLPPPPKRPARPQL